jgi:hypothetical protein
LQNSDAKTLAGVFAFGYSDTMQSTSFFQNPSGKPLTLDSLNVRVIAPAMQKAAIGWRGYYPGRLGISGKVTENEML